MSFPFSPHHGLIIVKVTLEGPTQTVRMEFALDTGSTDTVISAQALVAAGYDTDAATQHVQMTTGSGVVTTPLLWVTRLKALGQERHSFPVLAHQFPPSSDVDGVLGLDFLRGQELNINFRTGMIDLR
jgi:predicted aspartyl protease